LSANDWLTDWSVIWKDKRPCSVSADEDVGRAVVRRYGLGLLLTFVVFTADGGERYRESGMSGVDRLKEEVLAPS
jgi:hypothetical protein